MTDLDQDITSSIHNGITFLANNQLENGQFKCYMSNNDDILAHEGVPKGWFIEDSVVFPSALIGNSLLFLIDQPEVNDILNKVSNFLLAQKKRGSIWNHFTIGHNFYSICPFDLDDTACASAFLKARNIFFPSNSSLILSNINNKKLFYTWITPRAKFNINKSFWRVALHELKNPIKSFFFWIKMECSRGDIDAVVNANVLYYFGENVNTKPVIDYLMDIIINNQEADCDKWYRNTFTVYYFISRNYYAGVVAFEAIKEIIIERIIKQQDAAGKIGASALDTALAVCSLINLNYKGGNLSNAINFLIKEQATDGSWKKRAYYYGGPKKLSNWGSEELTTGVCLEALARYKSLAA